MSELGYDQGDEFYEPEPAPSQSGDLVSFARDFVAADSAAQNDLDSLSRAGEILSEEYAAAEPGDDTNYEYIDEGEQTGGLDPFADDFEQQLGAHVDQRLASMQVVDPYTRAAYAAERDAQQAAVAEQQQVAAMERAAELARPHLEDADARNFPMPQVLEAASAVASAWGMTPDVIAGLSDYEREQVATEAIRVASEAAGRASVQQSVLSRFGKRGGR